MLQVVSMEDVKGRNQATADKIGQENCNAEAEKEDKDHFYGWLPQPAEGATPGASVSRARTYGVLTEAFVPNKPGAKGPHHGYFKWFCCCHALCSAVYMSRKANGSSGMHDHLRDIHGVKKDTSKGRGLAIVKQEKVKETKSDALKHLGPKRYAALMVTLNIIKLMRPFMCVEDETTHATANADWVPCSAQTARRNVGEMFLAGAALIKDKLAKRTAAALLPGLRLNADLWTSKITKLKYLGVRVFWMSMGVMHTSMLACSVYAPPAVDPDDATKQASDWLLEYIVAVLAWYGIAPEDVAGATSDAGSDCKRAFDKVARQFYDWDWSWCWPHATHTALVAAFGTQKDPKCCTNRCADPTCLGLPSRTLQVTWPCVCRECRALLHSVRKVVEFIRKSPGNTKVFNESAAAAEARRRQDAQDELNRVNSKGIYSTDAVQAARARRVKHLASDVSQRWTSTITMLHCVLQNWSHIDCRWVPMVGATQVWCTNKDDISLEVYSNRKTYLENPIAPLKQAIVHLYSLAAPFGKFVGLTQTTNRVVLLQCVLALRHLFKTTLRICSPLLLQDPSASADAPTQSIDHHQLHAVARETRAKLAEEMEIRFLHRYAMKKHADVRPWMWDLAMYFYPPTVQRKASYMHVFLDLKHAQGEVLWTLAELRLAVEEKVVGLMTQDETARRRKREQAKEELAKGGAADIFVRAAAGARDTEKQPASGAPACAQQRCLLVHKSCIHHC